MEESDRIHTYQTRCPHLRPALIKDFVLQMDPDYFESFRDTAIIHHLELADLLTFDQPCAMHIQALPSQQYHLTIVAYDYFSEFATFCGVLSSFGLDIREAMIFTSLETAATSSTSIKPSLGLPHPS
jgi:[glutamine synthetase] adenylyltransferase / [glutamine synthetase]-adenylyl-L-tyrosine phosphorylase